MFLSSPTIFGVTVTFMFHSFVFSSPARSKYMPIFRIFFFFFFFFLFFTLWSGEIAESPTWQENCSSNFLFIDFVFLNVFMLPFLLLATVISFSLLFFSVYFPSPRFDASTRSPMLVNPLPPNILNIYNLSMTRHWHNG